MSDRKFRIWEVFASVNGNILTIARFPFRQRADADKLASVSRGGYVLLASNPRELANVETLVTADTHTQPVPVAVPVAVAVATAFQVWDDVNERYATTDGLRESPPIRFSDLATATEYAIRLNTFGGYGGWMSLRFHVREV